MKKRKFTYMIACFLAVAMVSCSSDEPNNGSGKNLYPDKPLPETLDESAKDMMASNETDFSLMLLKNATTEFSNSANISIPTYSAFTTLSMLANADENNARTSILNSMGFNGELNVNLLNEYNSEVLDEITKFDENLSLSRYNASIWGADSSAINPTFVSCLTSNYKADIIKDSPSGESGIETINEWINSKSAAYMINHNLMSNQTNDSRTIVNTIMPVYFWKMIFSSDEYAVSKFKNADATESEVKMMPFVSAKNVNYYKTDNSEAIELPTWHEDITMYIIMPTSETNLSSLVSTLSSDMIGSIETGFNKTRMKVYIPAVHVNSQYNLVELCIGKKSYWECGNYMADGSKVRISNIPLLSDFTIGKKGIYNTSDNCKLEGSVVDIDSNEAFVINRPFIYILKDTKRNILLQVGTVVKL